MRWCMMVKQLEGRKQLEERLMSIRNSLGCSKAIATLSISSLGVVILSVHNPKANSDEEDDDEDYNSMPVKRIGTKLKQNYMG